MTSFDYHLVAVTGNDDGIAIVNVPEVSSAAVSAGGYVIKDPGGTISDDTSAVTPNGTGVVPIDEAPLVGSYAILDGSIPAFYLVFSCQPGARIVVRTWTLVT